MQIIFPQNIVQGDGCNVEEQLVTFEKYVFFSLPVNLHLIISKRNPCFVNIEHGLVMFIRDDEDLAQQDQVQTEQAPITEEDLEIIKDRETNIRQLEVGLHHPPCSSDTLYLGLLLS